MQICCRFWAANRIDLLMQLVSLKGAEEANLVATCVRGSVVSDCNRGSNVSNCFFGMLEEVAS